MMAGLVVKLSRGMTTTVVAIAMSFSALAAPPADWSRIPVQTVKLFYPGQASYAWVTSAAHKRGDRKVKAGFACLDCHEADEAQIGQTVVKGGRLEPAPIAGKTGVIDLKVQAAHDDAFLYLRFEWNTQMARAGQMHDYMMYDGTAWTFIGGPRSSARVRSGAQPPVYEDRLAIMIDDGKIPLFANQGCWLTCHTGMRDMPDEANKDQVQAHALLGGALKKNDVRKYLANSRVDDAASWGKTRSPEEIAALKAAGEFVDLLQWRGHRSNPVGMTDDGYVLEYRLFDAGKGPFSWNVDRKTMTPKYMFDIAKVGVKAITVDDIGKAGKPHAIIRENNAVPFDPNAGWAEGDVLPGRLLSRADASGSAADSDAASGHWKDGVWTVEWARKLDTGHPEDDKILKVGGVYNVGFAVHDDNVTTRFHHVSFPLTLGVGVDGMISATTLK
jgi:hypothetical protein